jgi:PIN domain nuclease of toxin-antitoxin system
VATYPMEPPSRYGRRRRAYVSVVSPWEVAIKMAAGKLRLLEPPVGWFLGVIERDLREIPLDAGVACAAAALPPLHRDPFDRVIVAIAQAHGFTVLTSCCCSSRSEGSACVRR